MHEGSGSVTTKLKRIESFAVAVLAAGLVSARATAVADPAVPSGTAGRLIAHYHMRPVPQEGPWFSLSYSSEDQIAGAALPPRYAGQPRAAGNAIVAIVTPREFSAMHRLQSDEVWHFYGGSPLEMLLLYPDGHGRKITLGSDVLAGQSPQLTVPHGVWQGAAPRASTPGSYSFIGNQLSPGFDYADFEIGFRDALQRQYPNFAKELARLTRAEYARTPAGGSAKTESAGLHASAFFAREAPAVTVSPGVSLQELVGRFAREAKTALVSVARFTLAPGHATGTSFNHGSQEIFLITGGTGRVHLADAVITVSPDSTVFIPAQAVHSIEADPQSALIFYAISAPAFAPDDYVLVRP